MQVMQYKQICVHSYQYQYMLKDSKQYYFTIGILFWQVDLLYFYLNQTGYKDYVEKTPPKIRPQYKLSEYAGDKLFRPFVWTRSKYLWIAGFYVWTSKKPC